MSTQPMSKKHVMEFMNNDFVQAIAQAMVVLRYCKIEQPNIENNIVTIQAHANLWKVFEENIIHAFFSDARFTECYPELTDEGAARAALLKQTQP